MAFNAFIKIDNIDGGSTDRFHKGEIEILSFSWGLRQGVSGPVGGGGGAGKAEAADFTFQMESGKASPELAVAVCTGEHFKEALVTLEETRGAGRRARAAYYKIKFNECLISSYQVGGQWGGVPTDSVSLNFAKVELEYEDERGQGKASFCDFKKATGG